VILSIFCLGIHNLHPAPEALQRGHWSVVSSNCAIRTAMHAGWQLATAMLVQQVWLEGKCLSDLMLFC